MSINWKQAFEDVFVGILNFLVVAIVVWFASVIVFNQDFDYDKIVIQSAVVLTILNSAKIARLIVANKEKNV